MTPVPIVSEEGLKPFNEGSCTITHEGRSYSAGGALLWPKNGSRTEWIGMVYGHPESNQVRTWHGETIAEAAFGPVSFKLGMKMQSVRFSIRSIAFRGTYVPDEGNMIRVRGRKTKG